MTFYNTTPFKKIKIDFKKIKTLNDIKFILDCIPVMFPVENSILNKLEKYKDINAFKEQK